jgi:hypothetical protein
MTTACLLVATLLSWVGLAGPACAESFFPAPGTTWALWAYRSEGPKPSWYIYSAGHQTMQKCIEEHDRLMERDQLVDDGGGLACVREGDARPHYTPQKALSVSDLNVEPPVYHHYCVFGGNLNHHACGAFSSKTACQMAVRRAYRDVPHGPGEYDYCSVD